MLKSMSYTTICVYITDIKCCILHIGIANDDMFMCVPFKEFFETMNLNLQKRLLYFVF